MRPRGLLARVRWIAAGLKSRDKDDGISGMHGPMDEAAGSPTGSAPRVVLENCGIIDPESIDQYIARGGYRALSSVINGRTPQEAIDGVLEELVDAAEQHVGVFDRLGGRGVRHQEADREDLVVVGADELVDVRLVVRDLVGLERLDLDPELLLGHLQTGPREVADLAGDLVGIERLAEPDQPPKAANGVKLIIRDDGWLPLGSCPVRFEGKTGWIETGDSGQFAIYPESLRTERTVFARRGTDPTTHVRNFLDCVKTRKPANANSDVAAQSHVACHAAYIAWQLGRTLTFDPVKEEFVGDDEANRMRSREMRSPWTI